MKIKSNQIIYYASYSYANDKKFNLVLIVPHACVYAYISSSSATVTTRHQYYCHCSFRSLNVQSKQAVGTSKQNIDCYTKEVEMTEEPDNAKRSGREEKSDTRAHTHIIRIHVDLRANIPYALYYFLFSFTCLPTQFKISSFTSFIYPLKHFVLPRSLVASFSLMPPLILFFSHICFLFSDSAL